MGSVLTCFYPADTDKTVLVSLSRKNTFLVSKLTGMFFEAYYTLLSEYALPFSMTKPEKSLTCSDDAILKNIWNLSIQ